MKAFPLSFTPMTINEQGTLPLEKKWSSQRTLAIDTIDGLWVFGTALAMLVLALIFFAAFGFDLLLL